MTHKPRPGINPLHTPRTWEYDTYELNDRANMYSGYQKEGPLRAAFETGWHEARHAHGVFLPHEEHFKERHQLDAPTKDETFKLDAICETITSGYAQYWREFWAQEWALEIVEQGLSDDHSNIPALLDHQPDRNGCCPTCHPPLTPTERPFITAEVMRSLTNTFPCEAFLAMRKTSTIDPLCQACSALEDYTLADKLCTHKATPWPAFVTKENQ